MSVSELWLVLLAERNRRLLGWAEPILMLKFNIKNLEWGAVRIGETACCGRLNRNRRFGMAMDEKRKPEELKHVGPTSFEAGPVIGPWIWRSGRQ
jgi:hypothetical protein